MPARRWRRRSAVLILSVLSVPVLGLLLRGGPAHADSTYDALARATGVETLVQNPSIPIGLVVTGGGPEADAHQSSIGIGDANAAVPYFGDVVPGLAGTLGGIVGVPAPPYPLIASTNRGNKPVTTSYPGMTMHAESNELSTLASSLVGQDASGSRAEARVTQSLDGSVTASSDATARSLTLGAAVVIGDYESRAEVSADGVTGRLTRSSSLSIGQIAIPGGSITIPKQTPGHVFVPDPIPGGPTVPSLDIPTLPLPMGGETLAVTDVGFENGYFTVTLPGAGSAHYLVPASAVLAAFQSAGITITYQQAQKTTTGVIAPNLTFTTVLPSPPANNYYSGPTRVSFSLGQGLASVNLHPLPSFDGGAGLGGSPSSGATEAASGSTGAIAAPVIGSVPPMTTGTTGLSPQLADPAHALNPVGASHQLVPFDLSDIYLALVAVAALAFVTATAVRLMGVRYLWT